jgi:gliding motility-associated-like protein
VLKNSALAFAWILLHATHMFAQGYGAKFSINSDIGCAPFTVVVTDESGAPDTIAVNYDWGDGSPLDADTVHAYINPGTYDIIQTVANGNPRQDTLQITVVEPVNPTFNLFKCRGTRGSIVITDASYQEYYVDWGDGNSDIILPGVPTSHDFGALGNYIVSVKGMISASGDPVDSANVNCSTSQGSLLLDDILPPAVIDTVKVTTHDTTNGEISIHYNVGPNTLYVLEYQTDGAGPFTAVDTIRNDLQSEILITGLNTVDHYYCMRLTAFDPCGVDQVNSNVLCSVRFNLASENNRIRLLWNTSSADFSRYSIYKDNNLLVFVNSINSSEYIDQNLICGNTYCYSIILEENSGFESISYTLCTEAASTTPPDPVENINASVVQENIALSWNAPPGQNPSQFIIERSTDGTAFTPIDSVSDITYTDNDVNPMAMRYFYRIRYSDNCGNASQPSIVGSPVLLRADLEGRLFWSAYEGWQAGVDAYWLELYDDEGTLIERIFIGLDREYIQAPDQNNQQQYTYRVATEPADGNQEQVYSNFVDIIYRSIVEFPNVFTPNGDGLNDFFTFKGKYVTEGTMLIYNRWGELIFQTEDMITGWDGNALGREAMTGSYIYRARLIDETGVTFIKKGQVLLLR